MTFTDTQRAEVVARAVSQIDKPYQWGAAGPDSYDCSGLTLFAWKPYLALPHNSVDQSHFSTSHLIDARIRLPRTPDGVIVYASYFLLPGDLVFYYSLTSPSHVALYEGRNPSTGLQTVIQATGEKLDGTWEGVVRIPISQYAHPANYGFLAH